MGSISKTPEEGLWFSFMDGWLRDMAWFDGGRGVWAGVLEVVDMCVVADGVSIIMWLVLLGEKVVLEVLPLGRLSLSYRGRLLRCGLLFVFRGLMMLGSLIDRLDIFMFSPFCFGWPKVAAACERT